MATKKVAASASSVLIILIGIGVWTPTALAQTADGPRVAIQADGLILFPGNSESFGSPTFSPFLALELGILSRFSLRIGFSPPLGQDSGQQAFATNLGLNAWFGKRSDFFETGIGSYYQNTWCNGMPDHRAYTLYAGWRHVSRSAVFRFGGIVGMTPERGLVLGISFGLGRSIGSGIFRL